MLGVVLAVFECEQTGSASLDRHGQDMAVGLHRLSDIRTQPLIDKDTDPPDLDALGGRLAHPRR